MKNLLMPTLDLLDYDALFIDIDGTAVNSEPKIREIVNQMAAEHGYQLGEDHWKQLGGLGDKGVWSKVCEWHPPFDKGYLSGEIFEKARVDRYFEQIENVMPHQPVLDLTKLYLALGRDTGAVTNSLPHMAEAHLTMTGYPRDSMFLLTEVDAHSIGRKSKPDPYLYQRAFDDTVIARTNRGLVDTFSRAANADAFAPVNCLVLEDSPNGARAGIRAGHTTIQLIDMATPLSAEEVRETCEATGGVYHAMYMNQFADLVAAAVAKADVRNDNRTAPFAASGFKVSTFTV